MPGFEDDPVVQPKSAPVSEVPDWAFGAGPPKAPPSPWDQDPKVVQEASGPIESLQAGFQGSATGLAWRRKLPDLVTNPEHSAWWERALSGVGGLVGDAPAMWPGAIAGGAAGTAIGAAMTGPAAPVGAVVGGVLGGGAGMFGLPAAIRESYIQAIKSGDVDGPADWWEAIKEVAKTTGKEAGIGAITFGAGAVAGRVAGKVLAPMLGESLAVPVSKVGQKAIQSGTFSRTTGAVDVAAQLAAMTTVPAALQGRLPTPQEVADAAIVLGGVKAAHTAAPKIAQIFAKTGKTPAEVVADASADPSIKTDLQEFPWPKSEDQPVVWKYQEELWSIQGKLAELDKKAEGTTDAAPQALNPAEMAERDTLRARVGELQAERETTTTALRSDSGRETSLGKIYDDVDTQARAAGLPAEEAKALATIERERYRSRAGRLEADPWELYSQGNRPPLQIKAETPIEAPALFDTPADGMASRAPRPEPETTQDTHHAAIEVPWRELPLADLKLSTDVPQFKAGGNAEGVVEPLAGKFDPTDVGPIQVWERTDGRMEVISGRHRFDLAKRSGRNTIAAQVHREADGFTADDAAILDATLNIRSEHGSVADYAQFFEKTGLTKEDALARGLLGRSKGQAGFEIAHSASPEVFAAHRANLLSDQAALSIAITSPGNSPVQAVGLKLVNEGKSILLATNTMRSVELMAKERSLAGQQGDIFGFDDSAMREATAMAKRASSEQRAISEQVAAVSGASKRPELARKMGVDVHDPDAIKAKIAELKAEQTRWDNWPLYQDLVEKLRGKDEPLAQGPAPDFALAGETPAELKARNEEAAAQAKRKLAEDKEATAAAARKKVTADQADLFNTQRTLFQSLDEYGGEHRPPGPEDGAPLHDLTGGGKVYPDDVYSSNAARYYGHGGDQVGLDQQSVGIIQSLRNKPHATVKVYRAVPDDLTTADKIAKIEGQKAYILKHGKVPPNVETNLNSSKYYDQLYDELNRLKAEPGKAEEAPAIAAGDWVTINRNYAKDHGESTLRGNYKIISKLVKASEVFTNGDSIHEFGYWPKGSYETLAQENRGAYTPAKNLIEIFKAADASTGLHELGHSWLEEMKADAARPDAPEQIKADWDILRRELAIGEDGNISTASHEQFARGVERYAAEGRAPSPELMGVFKRFSEWLMNIYRELRALNVEISPEMHDVLDRMLALDDQIEAAREMGVPRAYVEEAKAETGRKIVPGFKAEQIAMEPYADELPKGAGSAPDTSHVNYQYINTPLDVKLTMQRMAEIDQQAIQKQRGGTDGKKSWAESNAEQAKYVNEILGGGEDTLKLLAPRDPEAAGPDVRLGVLKKLAVGAAKDSARLRDVLLEKGDDATVREQLEYMGSIERARMIQAEFLGERASVARALNALKDSTEGSGEIGRMLDVIGYGEEAKLYQSPAQEAANLKAQLDAIMLNFGGRTPLDIAKLHKQVNTLKGTFKLAKTVTEATGWEKMVEGWKAAILSGPVTHMANMMGNATFAVLRSPIDATAALIGRARFAPVEERVALMEPLSRVMGLLEGSKDGLKAGYAAMQTEQTSTKGEQFRFAIEGRKGEIIRLPFRALQAEDVVFKTMNERAELYTLASRQATVEGLSPLTREFRERIAELVQAPPDAMAAEASEAATRFTFNTSLGEKGQAVQNAVRKWHLEWAVPFIRTPANVAKELLRMTPLAPAIGEWRAEIQKGGVARDKAMAEVAVGTAISAVVMAWAFDGSVTGAGEPDPGKRRVAQAAGWQPYSIKIGDKYYSYQRLQPFGTLIGMAADVANVWDHLNEEESDKVPKMLSVAFANAITNQTFLQGITNVVQVLADPQRYGPKFVQQMAGSVVPGIVAQPTAMADPIAREVDSILDAVKSRIPGLRQELMPKRDIFGEPVASTERLGVVTPITTKAQSQDKVRTEAERLGVSVADTPKKTHIGAGSGKLGDVKLTPEERDKFADIGGHLAYDLLADVVNSPQWEKLPDLAQKRVFNRVFSSAHRVAALQAIPLEKRLKLGQEITEKVIQELTPEEVQ